MNYKRRVKVQTSNSPDGFMCNAHDTWKIHDLCDLCTEYIVWYSVYMFKIVLLKKDYRLRDSLVLLFTLRFFGLICIIYLYCTMLIMIFGLL